MNLLKLSSREKNLLFFVALAVVFLFYWYLLLDPLWVSIDKMAINVRSIKAQMEQLKAPRPNQQVKINIKSREDQVNQIISFIDSELKQQGINLTSLNQQADNNKISIEIKFDCTYYQFLALINNVHRVDTIIVIDSANIAQEKDHLTVGMRLLSCYN